MKRKFLFSTLVLAIIVTLTLPMTAYASEGVADAIEKDVNEVVENNTTSKENDEGSANDEDSSKEDSETSEKGEEAEKKEEPKDSVAEEKEESKESASGKNTETKEGVSSPKAEAKNTISNEVKEEIKSGNNAAENVATPTTLESGEAKRGEEDLTEETATAKIVNGDETAYFKTLSDALQNVEDGETVTLLQNITIGANRETEAPTGQAKEGDGCISISKSGNITLDLNGKTINSKNANKTATLVVDGGANLTITGNGTIKNENKEAILIKKGKVTIKNGTIEAEKYIAIEVGDHTAGNTDNFENTIINENGTIKGKTYGIVTSVKNSKIVMNNGLIEAEDGGIYAFNTPGTKVYMSGGKIKLNENPEKDDITPTGIAVNNVGESGESGLISFSGGEITGPYGIAGSGKDVTINISGGNIDVTAIGINSNNQAKNININITGGTINGDGAGIYKPETGTLNISDGTVKGGIGIVARQGTVNVMGGSIIGTGDGSDSEIGKPDVSLKSGVAILVDNVSTGYGDVEGEGKEDEIGEELAYVEISGGSISSNGDAPAIQSYNDDGGTNPSKDTDDFYIIGGAFSTEFNSEYIEEGKTELTVTNKNGSIWYVGNEAQEALENAVDGDIVEVLQGDIEANGIVDGVTIVNSGEGKVTINDIEIQTGELITINSPKPVESAKPQKDNTPKTGMYSNNEMIFVYIAIISLVGLVAIEKK